jgi:hypothetical protein
MLRRSLCVLLLGCGPLLAAVPGRDDWKYDVIYRKKGSPLSGLVLHEGPGVVTIRCITRKPGRPTLAYTENVPRAEIDRVSRLDDAERRQLGQRLDALKHEREVLEAHLRLFDPKRKGTAPPRADAFELKRVPWPPDKKSEAWAYQSAHFRLLANTRRELVCLAAIHLEQAYAAYARALPPRTDRGVVTTVLLTGSLAEYHRIASERGLLLANPAFYDRGRNEVVCGSDLEKRYEELQEVRAHHEQLRAALRKSKAELRKAYPRGTAPLVLLGPLKEAEDRIARGEAKNDKTFAAVRQRLFTRLYHEAFHAYLDRFVYPAGSGSLPVWLNEGLAQIFEAAVMEAGELRVGHAEEPDAGGESRLKAVRKALGKPAPGNPTLPSLAEVLRSSPKQFLVVHSSDKRLSDRYYLASWALAFHLTFEKRLLGTEKLDRYVAALKRGTDVLAAFEDLVGQPLPQFEKAYRLYLTKLQPDGTTRSGSGDKVTR